LKDLKPEPLPFTTDRLRLRRLREDDLPHFQAYRTDPDVGRWQGWTAMSDDDASRFLRDMHAQAWCPPGTWFQLAIASRHSDQLLGDMGVCLDAAGHTADLGFTLCQGAQGQGLASEAVNALVPLLFDHTPARRVRAIADVRNTASVALLERNGFKCYATLATTFHDEPCEEHFFVRHRDTRAKPRLRDATDADADAVAALMINCRAQLMPFAPCAHPDEDTRQWVAQELIPEGGVTVAEMEGRIVGVLAVQERDGKAWVDQLMVDPLHVKRGVGRTLLHHALATLPRPVQLWTFQPNQAARRFYEAQGFRAVGFTDGSGNEEQCPDVRYQLDPAA
jgi:RimJ/RimL family protein N-acetyltransferase